MFPVCWVIVRDVPYSPITVLVDLNDDSENRQEYNFLILIKA